MIIIKNRKTLTKRRLDGQINIEISIALADAVDGERVADLNGLLHYIEKRTIVLSEKIARVQSRHTKINTVLNRCVREGQEVDADFRYHVRMSTVVSRNAQ